MCALEHNLVVMCTLEHNLVLMCTVEHNLVVMCALERNFFIMNALINPMITEWYKMYPSLIFSSEFSVV